MQRFISRLAGIFIVIGIILTFEGVKDTMDSKKQPADFNTMTEQDLQKDMIVEGNILCNYGVFEEEYRTTYGIKTGDSDYTYLIPIGEKKFMGIKNQTSDQQIALDDQTNKTIDLLLGNSTVEPTPFHFKGRIKAMNSQDKGYMRDYLLEMGYSESEVDGYIVGYCIECVDFKGGMGEVGLGAALLVIAFLMFIAPTLERKQQERLSYSHDTVAPPVINNNYKNVDTFSANTYEPPETLKMPSQTNTSETIKMPSQTKTSETLKTESHNDFSETEKTSTDSNLDNIYTGEDTFDYQEQEVSPEEKPKSGLKLKLKDE